MKPRFLTKHWIKQAEYELIEHQSLLQRTENKKILDTMLELAQVNELTPERYAIFMSILSNERIGENDVQKYLINQSYEKWDCKE